MAVRKVAWVMIALGIATASGCGDDDDSKTTDGGVVEDSGLDSGTGPTVASLLPFTVSNLPSGLRIDEAPTADLELTSDACGTDGYIDTASGFVSCADSESYIYTTFDQPDTTYGTIEVALIIARNITLESNAIIKLQGTLPLMLIATQELVIEGGLDAVNGVGGGYLTSETDGLGPGGGEYAGSNTYDGAGGGAYCGTGGSSAARGGKGPVSGGGGAYGNPEIIPLIGGSAGGLTQGGKGGGAIQLVGGTSVTVRGLGYVNVGGGGGYTAGGGSGGSILIEAPSVEVASTLAANGGAGGGTCEFQGLPGQADDTPATAGSCVEARGGAGGAGTEAKGGNGTSSPATNTFAGSGGGSVGRIRINTEDGTIETGVMTIISPDPDTDCATYGTLEIED